MNENLVMNSNAKAAIRKNIEKPSRKRITPQKQSKTKSKARTNIKRTPEKFEQDSDNTFTEGFETTKEDSESEEEKSWDSFSE